MSFITYTNRGTKALSGTNKYFQRFVERHYKWHKSYGNQYYTYDTFCKMQLMGGEPYPHPSH